MNHSFIFIVISDISIFSLGKKRGEEGKNSRKTTKRNLHIYIYIYISAHCRKYDEIKRTKIFLSTKLKF